MSHITTIATGWFAATIMTVSVHAQPPVDIRAYGELPRVERADISPNGVVTAVIGSENGGHILQLIANNQIIQSIPLGDVKIRDVEWATDKLLMIDLSRTEKLGQNFTTDKAEIYKTLFVPLGRGDPVWLFDNQKKIANATYGWYGIRAVNGKSYGFFGGVEQKRTVATGSSLGSYVFEGGAPALFRVDLADFSAKRMAAAPSDEVDRQWLVDANGEIAATLDRHTRDGSWKIFNNQRQIIASGENRIGYVYMRALGYEGNTLIYYSRDEETGESSYYEVPLDGGPVNPVFQDDDIERFFVDPGSNRLLGFQRSKDLLDVHFFDPEREKLVKKIGAAFPERLISFKGWSDDQNIVIAQTTGNKDSGSWWLVDLKKLMASPIGFERPEIDEAQVGHISRVTYNAGDGLEMDGILTLPPGRESKNLPIVMLPHGGPTSEDQPVFDWWAQGIASRGYAVFQPNFRGSTNRDLAFLRAGHGEWGRKMQTDISDGMAHLAKQGIIDPKRACIVGASYGGYAALAGVTLQQGLYRCAVSVAGVADLSLMISTDLKESGSDAQLKRNLTNEIGSGRELKDVSPRRFAANADAPILLIHGKDDVVVPYKQSAIMADALKDNGKPHDFITLDGEDHWLSKEVTRLQMLEATIAFIQKYNPADPATGNLPGKGQSTQ